MMKTRLLSLLSLFCAAALHAQVTVYVQNPPSVEGPLEFTWASDWGQTPDLNDPANNVTGFACFVDDDTAADSLGCGPLVNSFDLDGKIAVVYRGSCEFGVKSLNAQNAGAIAVVIINNVSGAPVGMGAGTQGPNVTIPVVMISQAAGAQLRDQLLICGNVEMFIGSQTNFFQYNLGMSKTDVLVPRYAETNEFIAASPAEFFVDLGAMMHNYGSQPMNNAAVRAVVTKDGNTLYDQSSAGVTLASGDSLYVALPQFTDSPYSGIYSIAYTIGGLETDEFEQNNSITVSLAIGGVMTYAPADPVSGLAVSNLHVVPANNTTGFRSCITFKDANASRLETTGLWFSAAPFPVDTSLTDEVMTATFYNWYDAITGPITLPTDAGLSAITAGEYIFTGSETEAPIYMPFFDVVPLVDDQWYLLCLDSYSGIVRHGWDNSLSYDRTQETTQEPISCLRDGTTWYNGFTGITGAPSLGLVVIATGTTAVEETKTTELAPFPNPAQDFIKIPLKGYCGTAALQVFDAKGVKVSEQRTSIGGDGNLTVDSSNLPSGSYLFRMDFETGEQAAFRVQVVK